jgi:hypothetical protein
MAKHKQYRGITSISLGAMPVELNDSVKVMDVLVGAAVGVIGSGALRALLNKFAGETYQSVKGTLGPALPLLTGLGTGLVLYYAQKNMAVGRAKGHLVGAVGAGVAATVMSYLPKIGEMLPKEWALDFSDVVSLNLGGLGRYADYSGLLVSDQSDFNGLLVADKSDDLNQLAAYAMGDEDDDGLMSLSAM